MPANPICVALDTPDLDHAVALAKALKPHVGWAKVGSSTPMALQVMPAWRKRGFPSSST